MSKVSNDDPVDHPPINQHELVKLTSGLGACFVNSYHAIQTNPEWTLVHGWMIPPSGKDQGRPLQHAWLEREWKGEMWAYDPANPHDREMFPLKNWAPAKGIVRTVARYNRAEAQSEYTRNSTSRGPWHPDLNAPYVP